MTILSDISTELSAIRAQSLWKTERPILSPQSSHIEVGDHRIVIGVKNRNRSVPVRHWHQFVLHPESRQPGLPSRNANTVA